MNNIEMELMRTAILIREFTSKETYIAIWETSIEIGGERLFIIKSTNLKSAIDYIRYGNKTQANSIMNTYQKERRFSL